MQHLLHKYVSGAFTSLTRVKSVWDIVATQSHTLKVRHVYGGARGPSVLGCVFSSSQSWQFINRKPLIECFVMPRME